MHSRRRQVVQHSFVRREDTDKYIDLYNGAEMLVIVTFRVSRRPNRMFS